MMRRFSRNAGQDDNSEHVLVSLLLLRGKYIPITAEQLGEAVKAAFGVPLDAGLPLNTVSQVTPHSFLVKLGGEVLQVNNSARSYSPEPEKDAAGFPTAEWQEAWSKHRSWISVDYVKGEPISSRASLEKYPMLLTLISRFADENTLGLYIPGPTENDPPKFRAYDDEFRAELAAL